MTCLIGTDSVASHTHLEATVKIRHFFGVLPLRDSDAFLHLLGFPLDILPKRNETVNSGLECTDERLRIES